MKKLAAIGLLVVLVVSLIPSAVLADDSVLIYAGLADTPEELAFSVEHEGQKVVVFEGSATSDLDQVVLTLKGNRIYQGKVLTRDNVLFTIKDEHIIPGVDSRVSNALYTVRDGRIYAGNVTTPANVLYSFEASAERARLYEGKSFRPSDVVFTINTGTHTLRVATRSSARDRTRSLRRAQKVSASIILAGDSWPRSSCSISFHDIFIVPSLCSA